MSQDHTNHSHNPRMESRAQTEAHCLKRSLTPMPDDDSRRRGEKAIAVVLVAGWTTGTLGMTFNAVSTTPPPFWMPFTALVFLLIGRLWQLEVEQLLPGGLGGRDRGGSSGDD